MVLKAETFNLSNSPIAFNSIYRIPCHGDGSCFFHAICTALIRNYIKWSEFRQKQFVRDLRSDLAHYLPQVYNKLSRGTLHEFSREVKEYSLNYLVRELKSSEPVGNVYIEYLANEINRNILIIDGHKRDIYVLEDIDLYIQDRPCVVLLYMSGHYDLIGWRDGDRMCVQFAFNHPFILKLLESWRSKLK